MDSQLVPRTSALPHINSRLIRAEFYIGRISRITALTTSRAWIRWTQFSSRRGSSILTPLKSRNSIPCSSKIVRIALKFRSCIGGVPPTFSPREIAERETPHRSDKSRTDHLSNARAARSCAPVTARLEINSRSWVLLDTPAAIRSGLRCSSQLRFGAPRRSSRRA
jgi:hypothetical protein